MNALQQERLLSSALLENAHMQDGDTAERLARQAAIASDITRLLQAPSDESAEHPAAQVAGRRTLACLPSMSCVILGNPHTREVARQVAADLQYTAGFYADEPALNSDNSRGMEERLILGQLSEMAVQGVLWWGSAAGLASGQLYTWPTTTSVDQGHISADGKRSGVDLHMRESGRRGLMPIQVKTGRKPDSRDDAQTGYEPGIAVVSIRQITPEHVSLPLSYLLRALGTDDHPALRAAYQRAASCIDAAKIPTRTRKLARKLQPAS